jgi:hypothetical protein
MEKENKNTLCEVFPQAETGKPFTVVREDGPYSVTLVRSRIVDLTCKDSENGSNPGCPISDAINRATLSPNGTVTLCRKCGSCGLFVETKVERINNTEVTPPVSKPRHKTK